MTDDNPYFLPGTDCLKNQLGITNKEELAQFENDVTSARLANLRIHPLPGKLDYAYFKSVHKYICGGIYEWAGQERTVQTTRGYTRFEWPENIEKAATNLFAQFDAEDQLKSCTRTEFIARAAHYFGELNVIHPFPDGNGRTQRTLFDQIAREAGYEFNWVQVTKDQFIEAMIHAYAIDNSKLELVLDKALGELA